MKNQEIAKRFLGLVMTLPGLGPKTTKILFDRLKIKNIDDIEKLATQGKLRGLPGIQAKTEENILKGIEMIKRRTDRLHIGRVLPIAEDILKKLRDTAPVKKLSLAGSLRRWKDTIYSDGSHDIEQLIDEARKRGYKYIAITDHSKGLGVARGMSIEQILEQNKRIKIINKHLENFILLLLLQLCSVLKIVEINEVY